MKSSWYITSKSTVFLLSNLYMYELKLEKQILDETSCDVDNSKSYGIEVLTI
jgi:hypothetical protein